MKKLYHYPSMLIFSALTIFVLIVAEASAFVWFVLFDSGIYSESIGRKSVSDAVYEDLTEYFEQFSAPTGIPAEVFNDTLDKEELSQSSFKLLKDSLAYLTDKNAPMPEITYDFTGFEKSIVDYIEKYSEENDIPKDDDYYNLIDNTINTGETQIISRLDVMMLYTLSDSHYGKMFHEKSGLIRTVFFVSCGALAILVMILFIIDRRHLRDMPYWIGIILTVSSLVFLIPCIYLDKINYFSTFFVRSRHIYLTVTGVFQTLLERVIDIQFVILIVGIIFIVLTIVIHMLYLKYLKMKHQREK